MNFNEKIDEINIDNDRLHVLYTTGTKSEILFSELHDIFITVNKINPIYEFLIFMFSVSITLFAFFYLQTNLILTIASLLIVLTIVKMNNHKRYGMSIHLKNGTSIKKRVPLKTKNETVDFVNDVRRKIYNNKIETSNKLIYNT